MSFTVQDFQDLLQLLRERPDWRAQMERALLGDEFRSLPQIVRELAARMEELAEAQKRTEARVGELAEAQKRTEARVSELAEAQKRTEARLDQVAARMEELAEAQKRTEARVGELAARMEELAEAQKRTEARLEALTVTTERMWGDISNLRGDLLEIKYAERAPAYVSDFFRRSRIVPRQDYVTQLEEAEEQGKISAAERKDAGLIDLLMRGQRLPDRAQAHLALEISATIYPDDVERAARRAEIFSRVYPLVLPGVGGHGITADARKRAEEKDVKMTLDGVTLETRPTD